jgi:hypothetical protein
VHLNAIIALYNDILGSQKISMLGGPWEATGLILAEHRWLCLFYYETFEKHPFLPDFKTSKLATDTHGPFVRATCSNKNSHRFAIKNIKHLDVNSAKTLFFMLQTNAH